MDERTFLGMKAAGDDLHWRMEVTSDLSTQEGFLFGRCGLGATPEIDPPIIAYDPPIIA